MTRAAIEPWVQPCDFATSVSYVGELLQPAEVFDSSKSSVLLDFEHGRCFYPGDGCVDMVTV